MENLIVKRVTVTGVHSLSDPFASQHSRKESGLSFVRLRSRHQYSSSQYCQILRWSWLCVSRFFISSFYLYDESEHFALFRLYHSFVLFCGCPCSRCVTSYRRSLSLRRTVGDGVWVSSFLKSAPVCICGTSFRLSWYDSWFRSFPAGGMWSAGPSISRFHFLSEFQF